MDTPSNELSTWRLRYVELGAPQSAGAGLVFECKAEDITHAIEQCQAENAGAQIVHASVLDDSSALSVDADGDYELRPRGRCWLLAGNVSLRIIDTGDSLDIACYPYGAEDAEPFDVVQIDYGRVAHDAVCPAGTTPEAVQDETLAMHDHHVQRHAQYLQPDTAGLVLAARAWVPGADFAILVPKDRKGTGIQRGAAIVTPFPLRQMIHGWVHLHFEGNLYGMENLNRFVEKCYHAADRAAASYPTAARSAGPATDYHIVGLFSHAERRIVAITAPSDLEAWVGDAIDDFSL